MIGMSRAASLLLCTLQLWCTNAVAQDLELTPIVPPTSMEGFIIGGAPADPAMWPATLVFTKPERCTATVVGPRAVLTAAHCITSSNGAIRVGTSTVAITCTKNPLYIRPGTPDVAMCKATADVVVPGGMYESISTDANAVQLGASAAVLGYGCLVEGGTQTDVLYVGSVTITALPSSNLDIEFYGGSKLCAGDSGGAAYTLINARVRKIIGVQSSQTPGTKKSYATSLYAYENLNFIRAWGAANSAQICGLDQIDNCK